MVDFSACKLRAVWILVLLTFLGSQSNSYAVTSNPLDNKSHLWTAQGISTSRFIPPLSSDLITIASRRNADLEFDTTSKTTVQVANRPDAVTAKRDEDNLKAERLYTAGIKGRAIQLWEQILENDPTYLPAKYNLATAYFNERRFKDAAKQYFHIIEDDAVLWSYPDARYLGPLAYYRQFGTIKDLHGDYLEQYLVSGDSTFRENAERLRLLAVDRISSESIDVHMKGKIQRDLAKSPRNIVHFWAEWCNPCIKELRQLFKFSLQNPGITYMVVSVDADSDKVRADRRLNDLFAPYKEHPHRNIRFFHDTGRQLWKRFIPENDQGTQTVPRTVFLKGTSLVAYSPQQIAWENLDLMSIWEK